MYARRIVLDLKPYLSIKVGYDEEWNAIALAAQLIHDSVHGGL